MINVLHHHFTIFFTVHIFDLKCCLHRYDRAGLGLSETAPAGFNASDPGQMAVLREYANKKKLITDPPPLKGTAIYERKKN